MRQGTILLAVGRHVQQRLGLQLVDGIVELLLLLLHCLAQGHPVGDGALQLGEVIAQALQQGQLFGQHLARLIDVAALLQGAEHAVELVEDAADSGLAGVVVEHAEGDALCAQVFGQVVDPADFAELLRADDGVVQRTPAADGGGQGKQQDHSEAEGQLGSHADVAELAVEVAEHGESPCERGRACRRIAGMTPLPIGSGAVGLDLIIR